MLTIVCGNVNMNRHRNTLYSDLANNGTQNIEKNERRETKVIKVVKKDGKKLYKVISWYDNESSYVSQFVRTLKKFANL